MENIKLAMVLENLDDILDYKLPDGFKFSYYQPGDSKTWAAIEVAALEFESIEAATSRFNSEFVGLDDELSERCLFIETNDNEKIATIMAWYGNLRNKAEGRIHWVSIIPEYQGQNLAKPLLSKALHILSKKHKSVYLTTQTINYKAINLYLGFGFKPLLNYENDEYGWQLVEERLQRKILND